jgi:hypothetical protein
VHAEKLNLRHRALSSKSIRAPLHVEDSSGRARNLANSDRAE